MAERFCLIRWSDRNDFSIVAQRYIRASSNPIQVYETYAIEIDGKQRKGTLILIGTACFCQEITHEFHLQLCLGTKEECERLQQNVSPRSSTASNSH